MEIPVQLTLTLQTPNYNGHPAIANKSQPPRKMHEEMTEINSCYYRLLLLWKCRLSHFFFFFIIANSSSKIPTHLYKATLQLRNIKKPFFNWLRK